MSTISATSQAVRATIHLLAPADQLAVEALRQATAALKGQLNGPAARPMFDSIMQLTPAAAGVSFEADTVGGVPGQWCRLASPGAPASVGLFIHGGAFVMGSSVSHRNLVSQMAARTGLDFFVPDYRLAPEHPFPAALVDALAAYRGLVAQGKQRLVLSGDSAGGNLVLLALAQLSAEAAGQPTLPVPRAALVFSPWTDLALTSASMQTRAEADPIFIQAALASFAGHYLQGHDPLAAQASPVYGPLAGLPPVQVHVGDAEVLLDDSVRYVAQAQAAGVAAELHLWEGLPHGFAANVAGLLGASQALDLGASFLRSYL
jgi:monoterpene epsilon-lactone hydrolase